MSTMIQTCCERAVSEAGGIRVFTLRARGVRAEVLHTFRPGRHVAIYYPDVAGVPRQRLYSITRRREAEVFEIAVKRSGRSGVSDHLHATLQEGSVVPVQYVAGDISVESIADDECIGMVAGGIGITLPLALLRELAVRARNGHRVPTVVLMLCVQKFADIPFLHELLALDLTTTWFSLRVFITRENVQPGTHFLAGRPSADSLDILGQPQTVVICGSHTFAHDLRGHIATRFPAARVLVESFTPPEISAPEESQAGTSPPMQIHVLGSGEMIDSTPGRSLLEMLESGGAPIRSQCRSGICGTCRVKVSGGEYRTEPDFCLSDQDKHNGYALACCTFPVSGQITVDLRPNT